MRKISIIILIIGGFFFNKYGAKTEISLIGKKNHAMEEENVSPQSYDIAKKELSSENNYYNKKIEIDSDKCIGCGKCVMVAPNNFTFNRSSRLAEVKSQNNINSAAVSRSIRICPTKAISI